MRIIPLIALAIPLSGCILPPVMVAASYAGDAALAVGTEKTSSDHLLSMMEKRDCALWRVIKGRPICHDWADGKDPYEKYRSPDGNQVATAGSDAGFTADMAKDSRQDVERRRPLAGATAVASKGGFDDGAPKGVLIAQAGGTSPVTTPSDVMRANQPDRTLLTGPFNPVGVPPVTPPPAATMDANNQPPPSAQSSVTPAPLAPLPSKSVDNRPAGDGAPPAQPVAPPAVGHNDKPVVTPAPAAPPVVAGTPPAGKPLAAPTGERTRYVVIGSYRQHANAERVVREHAGLKPTMQDVTVRGERYYRVVAGPFTPTQAAEIRVSLKRKSHIDADVARNCASKGRGLCIDING